MTVFTFDLDREYLAALLAIIRLGVDYEEQPDELTIYADDLTPAEVRAVERAAARR